MREVEVETQQCDQCQYNKYSTHIYIVKSYNRSNRIRTPGGNNVV